MCASLATNAITFLFQRLVGQSERESIIFFCCDIQRLQSHKKSKWGDPLLLIKKKREWVHFLLSKYDFVQLNAKNYDDGLVQHTSEGKK